MNKEEIERGLRLHIDYVGKTNTYHYLKIMDQQALQYSGPPAIKVSKLLDDYFEAVGVSNLDEALRRLKKIDNIIY